MPTLEISADDIVCSHGASVADLDENSMFYLSARGIDRKVNGVRSKHIAYVSFSPSAPVLPLFLGGAPDAAEGLCLRHVRRHHAGKWRACRPGKPVDPHLSVVYYILSPQDPGLEARLIRKLQSLQGHETNRPGTVQLSAQKYLSI
jgi:hypothetical protein